jgi:hypothetical protein
MRQLDQRESQDRKPYGPRKKSRARGPTARLPDNPGKEKDQESAD